MEIPLTGPQGGQEGKPLPWPAWARGLTAPPRERWGGMRDCPQITPGPLVAPCPKSAGGLGNCCAFDTLQGGYVPPILCPAGLCQEPGSSFGAGGKQGGGLQPFGVSFVLSLCSCAWICAWSQDIWVLSEQLTLASETSLCLTFPLAPRGGLSAGGVWGLCLSQGTEPALVLGKHSNNTFLMMGGGLSPPSTGIASLGRASQLRRSV